MTIVFYLILALHIFVCFFLIAVVLLQQGKSQDLASAFGGGGTQTAFGPRGSANVLSRTTTILAGVFMLTSIALSLMRTGETSVLDRIQTPQASPSAAAATPPPAPAAQPTPAGAAAPSPASK